MEKVKQRLLHTETWYLVNNGGIGPSRDNEEAHTDLAIQISRVDVGSSAGSSSADAASSADAEMSNMAEEVRALQKQLEQRAKMRENLEEAARQAAQEEERLQRQLSALTRGARPGTPPNARPREEDEEHPSGGRAPRAPGLASARKERKGKAPTARASLAARIQDEVLANRLASQTLADCDASVGEDL